MISFTSFRWENSKETLDTAWQYARKRLSSLALNDNLVLFCSRDIYISLDSVWASVRVDDTRLKVQYPSIFFFSLCLFTVLFLFTYFMRSKLYSAWRWRDYCDTPHFFPRQNYVLFLLLTFNKVGTLTWNILVSEIAFYVFYSSTAISELPSKARVAAEAAIMCFLELSDNDPLFLWQTSLEPLSGADEFSFAFSHDDLAATLLSSKTLDVLSSTVTNVDPYISFYHACLRLQKSS